MGLTSSERWLQRSMSWVRRGWGVSSGVSGRRSDPSRKSTRQWRRGGERICRTVPVSTAVALRTSSSDLPGTGWDAARGGMLQAPQRLTAGKKEAQARETPKGVPDRQTLPPAAVSCLRHSHLQELRLQDAPEKLFLHGLSDGIRHDLWVTVEAEPRCRQGATRALQSRPGAPYRVGAYHQLIEVVQPAEEGSQVLLPWENPVAGSITLRPARGRGRVAAAKPRRCPGMTLPSAHLTSS